jgi:Mn-dependent DtxR family transcriptional regulator
VVDEQKANLYYAHMGWDVLDRLHQSGYIHDPVTKAKSVLLTEEGAARSKRLFEKHFAKS